MQIHTDQVRWRRNINHHQVWPSGRWSLESSGKSWRNGSRQRVWEYTGSGTAVRQDWSFWQLRIFGVEDGEEKGPAKRGTKDQGKKIKTQNKFITTHTDKYSLLWCIFYYKNKKEVELGKHALSALFHVKHSATFRRILLDSKDLLVQYNHWMRVSKMIVIMF